MCTLPLNKHPPASWKKWCGKSCPAKISLLIVCLMIVAGSIAINAAAAERNELLGAANDLRTGARLVTTKNGTVLIAAATVPVPPDPRADRAFGTAATAAMIEARAEAALFLGGVYGSSSDSALSQRHEADRTMNTAWVRTHMSSLARVRLASGETLRVTREDGGVRAVLAWGVTTAAMQPEKMDDVLPMIAAKTLASAETPARDIRWVKYADGREGLLVVIVVYPDGELHPLCERPAQGADTCGHCQACRDTALASLLSSTVAGWAREGDVGVARLLTRTGKRTFTKAKDGTESIVRVSERMRNARTSAELSVELPPVFHAKTTKVFRHEPRRSVCAAFVPAGATPTNAVKPAAE